MLELEPENAWVQTYLGHVLVELGDIDRLDEAAAHCRRRSSWPRDWVMPTAISATSGRPWAVTKRP